MSIISQPHSQPVHSRSRDAPIGGACSAPRRRSRPRIKPRHSGVPAIMGPPNHAPGLPVMGAPSPGLHLDVMSGHAGPRVDPMGGPDAGPRVDPMGGPDAGPRVDLMGESDLTFVDSLFTRATSVF
jgi:hypothetical protein